MGTEPPDLLCSGRELAAMLGLSERALRDHADQGHVVKAARGKYQRIESVRRYCEHLRSVAAGRGGEAGVTSLTSERARLAREQADAVALKNAATRGELLPASEVERCWRSTLAGVRSRMMAVPGRIRQAVPQLSATDVAAIDREIRDGLEECSRGEFG